MRIPPGLISGLISGLVALLAGCAGADPGLRVADPPHAAAADDVDRADLTFTARDGLTLYDQVDDLLDDLDAFVARVRDHEPGRPIVLHGDSLGGLATALYAIELSEPGVGAPTAPPAGRPRRAR